MNSSVMLQNRAIIEIEGEDRYKFLQGLITNDINKATSDNLIYSAMLSAQGRFLYDFFIFAEGEKLILDCAAAKRDEIVQKLGFYKLRSKVIIKKNDQLKIYYSQNGEEQNAKKFVDPRNANLGFRIYYTDTKTTADSATIYDFNRIVLKIPEGEVDLTSDKSFILEFGFDDLNAIDYQKGCYVGQELTARTHYRGEIRKKILHVIIDGTQLPAKNGEITCEGKSAGIILSAVFHQNATHALALVKDSQEIDFKNLELEGNKILVID